jgi:hypothetical protein
VRDRSTPWADAGEPICHGQWMSLTAGEKGGHGQVSRSVQDGSGVGSRQTAGPLSRRWVEVGGSFE